MLRLDRNPPSQLWGQHSAKACTAPTQLRTLALLLLLLAPERARCSSGPGGYSPASARGSRALASTRVLSRARMYQSWGSELLSLAGYVYNTESFLRSKTRQQLSNASCSFWPRALSYAAAAGRRAGKLAPRARGVGCCCSQNWAVEKRQRQPDGSWPIQQAAVEHIIKNDRQSYYCSIHSAGARRRRCTHTASDYLVCTGY